MRWWRRYPRTDIRGLLASPTKRLWPCSTALSEPSMPLRGSVGRHTASHLTGLPDPLTGRELVAGRRSTPVVRAVTSAARRCTLRRGSLTWLSRARSTGDPRAPGGLADRLHRSRPARAEETVGKAPRLPGRAVRLSNRLNPVGAHHPNLYAGHLLRYELHPTTPRRADDQFDRGHFPQS
jgi:hypothetical protein